MLRKKLENITFWREYTEQEAFIKKSHSRIFLLGIAFFMCYSVILYRLISIQFLPRREYCSFQISPPTRADILDINGNILATDILTYSIFVDPKVLLDTKDTAKKLQKVLAVNVYEKIKDENKRFVWVARHVCPKVRQRVEDLGLPGVYFRKDYKRIYPYGRCVSHILGYCSIDHEGLVGIEKAFDEKLRSGEEVQTSIDVRIQSIAHKILQKGIKEYSAEGGSVIIMNNDGEILSSVSLPDYEPNFDRKDKVINALNVPFQGCYDPGSIMKVVNVAIALQSGKANLQSKYDARYPIKIGRFKIDDLSPKRRILSLLEAFIYSSNIAMIKMADEFGIEAQKYFFDKLGLLQKVNLEIKETQAPLTPKVWTDIILKTVAYGYGVSMPPVSALVAIASILNNGVKVCPTLLKRTQKVFRERIFDAHVSNCVKKLMREVVLQGTGKKANVPGYYVVGKTGTAQKLNGRGGYDRNKRYSTFVSSIILGNRQYYFMIILDNPKPKESNFATAAWNCVPLTKEMIEKCGPILKFNSGK